MYNNTSPIMPSQNPTDIAKYLAINKELHQDQRSWVKMPLSPERDALSQKIALLKKELNHLNKRLNGVTA
ncbi:MAG: hypothetical protein K0R22_2230 [Sporomusa sp.]|jgi:hypothetical protein|nr:hypothetical protein [Sporomusa sp.]